MDFRALPKAWPNHILNLFTPTPLHSCVICECQPFSTMLLTIAISQQYVASTSSMHVCWLHLSVLASFWLAQHVLPVDDDTRTPKKEKKNNTVMFFATYATINHSVVNLCLCLRVCACENIHTNVFFQFIHMEHENNTERDATCEMSLAH